MRGEKIKRAFVVFPELNRRIYLPHIHNKCGEIINVVKELIIRYHIDSTHKRSNGRWRG